MKEVEGIITLFIFLYCTGAIVRIVYWTFFYSPVKIARQYWKPKDLYFYFQIIVGTVLWPIAGYLDRKIKKCREKSEIFYDKIK